MKTSFRTIDILAPLGFVLLGAVILHQTYTTFAEAGAASGDALSNSALFPRFIAWGAIATGAAILLQTLFGGSAQAETPAAPEGQGEPDKSLKLRAFASFIAIVIYFAALPLVGFYLSTAVLMILLFAVLGARPLEAAVLGVLVTAITVIAFEKGLNVVFPVGRLGLF